MIFCCFYVLLKFETHVPFNCDGSEGQVLFSSVEWIMGFCRGPKMIQEASVLTDCTVMGVIAPEDPRRTKISPQTSS